MNFKNISVILLLTIKSNVLSSPVIEKFEETTEKANNEVCLTPECYELSKKILTSMDPSVNPCEDFYQFTCGGWMNSTDIPNGKRSYDIFTEVYLQNLKGMTEVLKGDYQVDPKLNENEQQYDKKTFYKLKNLYNTCINQSSQDKNEAYKYLIKKLNIEENLNNYKNKKIFTELISKLHDYGLLFLFQAVPFYNLKVFGESVMTLEKSYIGQSVEVYYNSLDISNYKNEIKETLMQIFDNRSEKTINVMVNSIFEFEKKLFTLAVNSDVNRYSQKLEFEDYVRVSLKELNTKYDFMDWKLYFEKRLEAGGIDYSIDESFKIVNNAPEYLENLNKLIKQTDSATLTYFAEWISIISASAIVEYNIPDMIKQTIEQSFHPQGDFKFTSFNNLYQKSIKNFNKYLNVKKFTETVNEEEKIDETPISEYCYGFVNIAMDMALGKVFVGKYYSDEIKKDIEEKITNFEEIMIQRISQTSWIDEQTKNYAIQKVSKIKNKIGYPDYIKNPEKLYEKYEKLEVDDKDFNINTLNYWKFIMLEDLKSIKYPLSKDDWRNPPQTLNAFNEIYSNYMVYPAGILQPLFYKTNEPDYLIYSSIGAMIGHEITHAFDNTGRLYDEEGNIKNWWTYSTAKEYDNLTQCFIDQYSNYYIEDSKGKKYYVNGLATLGENIADNGGFTRSFEAWKKSMTNNSGNNRNFELPGLSDYTIDQLFYIAFGQFFCKIENQNVSIENISRDVHSPSKFRVNGYVSNSENFAKIFNCPIGSSMNPDKKCLIW